MNASTLQALRDADARGTQRSSAPEPALRSHPAPLASVSAETLLGAILANHQPGTLCVVQFVACGDGQFVACGDRQFVTCGDRQFVTCGDRQFVTCGDRQFVTCGDRQFVACGDRAPARAVATAFAAASASRFGRTLALETDVAASAETPGGQPPGATDLALRLTTPDVAVPGLTHARIESGSSLMIQALLRDWSNGAGRPFAMVVFDSAAPAGNAQALTLARSCTATILVAQAGLSPITALRDTQRRLVAAGAVLPGFVFVRDQAKSPGAHMPRR